MDKEQTTGPRPGCLCWWWNPYVGKCHRSHTTSVHSHMPSAMGSARSNMSGWAFLPQRRQHWLGNRVNDSPAQSPWPTLKPDAAVGAWRTCSRGRGFRFRSLPRPRCPPKQWGTGHASIVWCSHVLRVARHACGCPLPNVSGSRCRLSAVLRITRQSLKRYQLCGLRSLEAFPSLQRRRLPCGPTMAC